MWVVLSRNDWNEREQWLLERTIMNKSAQWTARKTTTVAIDRSLQPQMAAESTWIYQRFFCRMRLFWCDLSARIVRCATHQHLFGWCLWTAEVSSTDRLMSMQILQKNSRCESATRGILWAKTFFWGCQHRWHDRHDPLSVPNNYRIFAKHCVCLEHARNVLAHVSSIYNMQARMLSAEYFRATVRLKIEQHWIFFRCGAWTLKKDNSV